MPCSGGEFGVVCVSGGTVPSDWVALWRRPEFVVVSGGHEAESRSPSEAVKESYRARGALVLHTAETGAVRVELSAGGVRVSTFRRGDW